MSLDSIRLFFFAFIVYESVRQIQTVSQKYDLEEYLDIQKIEKMVALAKNGVWILVFLTDVDFSRLEAKKWNDFWCKS